MLSRHFKRSEFACKCGCGQDTVDAELLKVVEDVRDRFGKAVTITSGNRCKEYNKSVGGAENSQHLLGRAADIVVANATPTAIYEYLNAVHNSKYGLGKYTSFTHIDTRSGPKARW